MNSANKDGCDELLALAELIKSSVDNIVKVFREKQQPYPSLDQPFSPETEALRMSTDVQKDTSVLVGAASQLIAATRPTFLSLLYSSMQFYIPGGVAVAVELHVADILQTAGPQGLHASKIAAYTGSDANKLSRVLRLLAADHIFKEVSPDTFANNRISSMLATGKTIEDILANPAAKHEGTSGVPALVEHLTDDGFKAGAYLADALVHAKWAHSGKPNETASNLAFNMDVDIWSFWETPGHEFRMKRFAAAMNGTQNMVPATVETGIDWATLPKDALVVDVGGGVGVQSLALAKSHQHLRFVVQDRQAVIDNAQRFWREELPGAVESGRVILQPHDFFTSQPVKEPAVFFVRMILHDWADEYALQILQHLREAAGPHTQLVVTEHIISYACEDPQAVKDIPGAAINTPPTPLLPNFGQATITAYFADMHMLASLNGSERTLLRFKELFEESGWRLVRIVRDGSFGTLDVKILGVPI